MFNFELNNLLDVEGYLSDQDKITLQKYSSLTFCLDGDILEVGTYCGLSTLCMLSKIPPGKVVHTIDISSRADAWANINRFHCLDRVNFYCNGYEDPKKELVNKKFCLQFFDHDHSYKSTKDCVDLYLDNLVNGGYIIFHDYGHADYPGGTQYIRELERGLYENMRFLEFSGCCAIFQKN